MNIARARIVVCHPATLGVRRTADAEPTFLALGREFPTVDVQVEVDGGAPTPLPTVDAATAPGTSSRSTPASKTWCGAGPRRTARGHRNAADEEA